MTLRVNFGGADQLLLFIVLQQMNLRLHSHFIAFLTNIVSESNTEHKYHELLRLLICSVFNVTVSYTGVFRVHNCISG